MNSKANVIGTGNFEFEALRYADNYRHALITEFSRHLGTSVIEVGAGIGQITELLATAHGVEKVQAVEPDQKFCAEFRRRLPNLPLIEGTASDLPETTAATSIVCINVLEHIEKDEQELALYARLLRGNAGTLCLFVPARPEIYSSLDADFGHFRRYTRPGLKAKLTRAGFKVLRLQYFNFVGYFAWWFNFCLLRQRRFQVSSVRFFDKVIFPVMRFCESRILRPPFGQSLLAVAKVRDE